MKLRAVVLLFAFACSSALGAIKTDLLGTWTGSRSEVFNGRRIVANSTLTVTRLQVTGLRLVERLEFLGGLAIVNANSRLLPNGDFRGTVTYQNRVMATATGRWRVANGAVVVDINNPGTGGNYVTRTTLRLPNLNTLNYVNFLSNGRRVPGVFTRSS